MNGRRARERRRQEATDSAARVAQSIPAEPAGTMQPPRRRVRVQRLTVEPAAASNLRRLARKLRQRERDRKRGAWPMSPVALARKTEKAARKKEAP